MRNRQPKFRIATDGCRFRIEVLTYTFWCHREKWVAVKGHCGVFASFVPMFDSEVAAKQALDILLRKYRVWKGITNSETEVV